MGSINTKAISFKFMSLTKTKQKRLQKTANLFKKIYNLAAIRLPSLKEKSQSKSRVAIEAIRKDSRSELYTQITQEAIEYARSNYCTIIQSGENKPPQLKADIIRIHNQAWSFKYKNDRCYLVFPIERQANNRYSKIWLPIKTNDFLNNMIKTTKFGVGQINLNNQTFMTSFKVKNEFEAYTPETMIGIDLGLNNLAVMAVLNVKNQVLKTIFWNGKEVRHIRKRFHNYRKAVQKIGRMDCNKKSKGFERNWMKNVNHNISREIIEIAKKYKHPIIQMEELHRFKRGKIQWNFYQLRQMIQYKAELKGIKFKLIDPKGTSQTCNKCGHISADNRNGLNFKCVKCNYSVHADFNAAINIAKI